MSTAFCLYVYLQESAPSFYHVDPGMEPGSSDLFVASTGILNLGKPQEDLDRLAIPLSLSPWGPRWLLL